MDKKTSKIKYISLIEASRISGYAPDYLGQLMRKQKLGGEKIGRDRFTTLESLHAYMDSKKFLPVQSSVSPAVASFLFSIKEHFSARAIVAVLAGILLLWAVGYYVVYPGFSSFKIKQNGDAPASEKLSDKNVIVSSGSDKAKGQEISATSYVSDTEGNIEISIKASPAP